MTRPRPFRLVRAAASILSLVVLAACNVVVTQAPLFTRADEARAPAPRPGLWRFDGDADCRVEESRPLIEWPECGAGAMVGAGTAGFFERRTGAPVWTVQPLILAAGEPRIAQAKVTFSGDIKANGPTWAYVGARATKLDDRGRIVAMSFWPVQCGPPPPPDAEGGGVGGTTRPLPGMIMKPGEPACATVSVGALRHATKLSEAWARAPVNAHWLRDRDS